MMNMKNMNIEQVLKNMNEKTMYTMPKYEILKEEIKKELSQQ